jgi:hypothetical protein
VPLPVAIAAIIAVIRAAAVKLVKKVIPRLIKRFGAYFVAAMIEAMKDELMKWVERWLPKLVLYWIKRATGLELEYPVTAKGLTDSINKRLGQTIFTDVTNRSSVEDFRTTRTGVRQLGGKLRVFTKKRIKEAWAAGQSQLMPADVVADSMEAARGGYDWKPHVNSQDPARVIHRELSQWRRAHMLRVKS